MNPLKIATVVLCLLLTSCQFRALKRNLETIEQTSRISGRIVSGHDPDKPVLVALYRHDSSATDNKNTLATYWVVYGTGSFKLFANPGRYYLLAFEDSNENMTFDPDEWVGWYGDPSLIETAPGQHYDDLEIRLMEPDRGRQELPELYARKSAPIRISREYMSVGDIKELEDSDFDPANGRLGLWEPVTFVQRKLSGIFFLEPYDAEKIPVVFIHGAGGTPRDWKYLIDGLDREKFQPWVYYYPSGLRLSASAQFLAVGLRELQVRRHFRPFKIVAHSMGGLVARAAIGELARDSAFPPVSTLITIATPWQGHAAAQLGVDHAPAVVPSWYDLVPGSPFQKQTSAEAFPPSLRYYLLFGYRGVSSAFGGENGDGTVALKSILDPAMQNRAEKVYGFDENHAGILKSPEAGMSIRELLSRETAQ